MTTKSDWFSDDGEPTTVAGYLVRAHELIAEMVKQPAESTSSVKTAELAATVLVCLDCAAWYLGGRELVESIRDEAGVGDADFSEVES